MCLSLCAQDLSVVRVIVDPRDLALAECCVSADAHGGATARQAEGHLIDVDACQDEGAAEADPV